MALNQSTTKNPIGKPTEVPTKTEYIFDDATRVRKLKKDVNEMKQWLRTAWPKDRKAWQTNVCRIINDSNCLKQQKQNNSTEFHGKTDEAPIQYSMTLWSMEQGQCKDNGHVDQKESKTRAKRI